MIIDKLKKLLPEKNISKKSVLAFVIILSIGLFSFLAFYIYNQYYPKEITLGLITDIHAGDQKYREDGDDPANNLFPSNYEKNMLLALENLKDADIIMTLGDNMNRGGRKHARKLKEIAENYPMVWTKGNHDKKNEFMEILSPQTYYYVDKGAWRIIILDNSEKYPDAVDDMEEHGRGYIDKDQMDWLEKSLKTRKKVAVAMHIPMLRRNNLEELRPDYKELEKILAKSGNVKYVFSGHFHVVDWNKKINGVKYYIIPSLSLENHEGQFKKIILNNE
ncbi:MAG: metallophosphoesterase [Candidatus Moranbacteria bacterium]|nr:metallophosphoesterase [Candidatus Moranbacteria bacterium]